MATGYEKAESKGVVDLGRKMGAEIMAKPAMDKKHYPSMYVDGLPKGSPLAAAEVGDVLDCDVKMKVVSKTQNAEGNWSVTLEAQKLKMC